MRSEKSSRSNQQNDQFSRSQKYIIFILNSYSQQQHIGFIALQIIDFAPETYIRFSGTTKYILEVAGESRFCHLSSPGTG
jgi:hypothetical protein